LHVLIVENDPRDCELLVHALTGVGLRATCAATDLDAYAAMAAEPFDALVTDIDLGAGTTGFDVARQARRTWPDLPVIYMTGLDLETARHAVAGSVALPKSGDYAELAGRIAETLGRAR
jgi:DNA-binding response OmpR family regulator